jgi:hypothetical protein
VAPGDQEFFRVTSAPCRINEAGALSDAARRANAGDLPGIYARRIVCTESSIRVDNANESPNLGSDDRPVLPLLVPVRLAVQVEEST